MTRNSPSLRLHVRLGVVAGVFVLLIGAWHFGVLSHVADPRGLAESLVARGVWGYLAFVVTYTVLQPFGVPGTIFIVAAPLLWPWHVAFALSMIGTMAASVVGFSFARFVARDWISSRIPERFRRYDDALARNAFLTVVVLRLIFWMPQMLHAFFGVSKVRFSTHFWGSLVGYAPPLLLVSALAASMFDASGKMQPAAWPVMAGLVVASLVIAAIALAYERRRSRKTSNATPQTAPE